MLQFQLTVNFVALVLSFVAAISNGETPLTVIQLLWVNLIMDALGALGDPCSAHTHLSSMPFLQLLRYHSAVHGMTDLCIPAPAGRSVSADIA